VVVQGLSIRPIPQEGFLHCSKDDGYELSNLVDTADVYSLSPHALDAAHVVV
jgi:hypothetical protein